VNEESIFEQALQQPDRQARETFLREACGADDQLLTRIQRLLAAHDRSQGLLEAEPPAFAPTREFAGEPANPAEAAAAVGSVISMKYKLLECLGEGGMGTIYVAEQTAPVRRKVALKLIKPGHDSKYVLARFEAERQTAAQSARRRRRPRTFAPCSHSCCAA
jgi:serine/threonine protein kinase